MIYLIKMRLVVDGARFLRSCGAKTTPVDEGVWLTLAGTGQTWAAVGAGR